MSKNNQDQLVITLPTTDPEETRRELLKLIAMHIRHYSQTPAAYDSDTDRLHLEAQLLEAIVDTE